MTEQQHVKITDEVYDAFQSGCVEYAEQHKLAPGDSVPDRIRAGLAAVVPLVAAQVRAQVAEDWRGTYEAKVADFAAETKRTSTLVKALHDGGHRAEDFVKNRYCGLCDALREVGAIDPYPWGAK